MNHNGNLTGDRAQSTNGYQWGEQRSYCGYEVEKKFGKSRIKYVRSIRAAIRELLVELVQLICHLNRIDDGGDAECQELCIMKYEAGRNQSVRQALRLNAH